MNEFADLFLPDAEGATSPDYYDFGCSSGGNLAFIAGFLPELKGVGIDINEAKVALAQNRGQEAIVRDILKMPESKQVDFVTMAHFLEHLLSTQAAGMFLRKAARIARSFVHVRQPWFDADGYLLSKGLKFYWSDCRGHRNAMTSLDFHKICRDLLAKGEIASFGIYGRGPIADSESEMVIPVDAPFDSQKYVETLGPKPAVGFEIPVFAEILVDIAVVRGAESDANRRALLRRLDMKLPVVPIIESAGHCWP